MLWTHHQMGNGLCTDHPSARDDNCACCLKPDSAYTKWLGHPLVHVLLKIKACRNPQWQATKVLADFWLEDEEAYKARNRGISGGMMVRLVANRQGVEE